MDHFRTFEPARLEALKAVLYKVAAVLGIMIPLKVDATITAYVSGAVIVLTLIQGELTRRKVSPAPRPLPAI